MKGFPKQLSALCAICTCIYESDLDRDDVYHSFRLSSLRNDVKSRPQSGLLSPR